MLWRSVPLLAALVLAAAPASAEVSAGPSLMAYGPGGPHLALQEAADLFREKHGVEVGVVKERPTVLARKLRENGDIYFTGAEFMLEDFVREHPEVLDLHTLRKLYPRRIGILVREGNPLGIEGLECLREEGVNLLVVHLECMEPLFTPPEDRCRNVQKRVYTGSEGAKAWRDCEELDAWVTYKTWHVGLGDDSEFIEVPGRRGLRHTIVALTRHTPNRQAALAFLDFLKTPEARRIFQKHGWE